MDTSEKKIEQLLRSSKDIQTENLIAFLRVLDYVVEEFNNAKIPEETED